MPIYLTAAEQLKFWLFVGVVILVALLVGDSIARGRQ